MENLIRTTLLLYGLLRLWNVHICEGRRELSVNYDLLNDLLSRTSADCQILTNISSPNGSLQKALLYNSSNASQQNWDISEEMTMAIEREWNSIFLHSVNNSTTAVSIFAVEIQFFRPVNSSDTDLPLFSVSHEMKRHSSLIMKKWIEFSIGGYFLSIHGGHFVSHLLPGASATTEDDYNIQIPHVIVNGSWYHVVLSIDSHKSLRVFLNCSLIYSNSTFPWNSLMMMRNSTNNETWEMKSELKIRLGQRFNDSHIFQGIMREAKISLLAVNSSTAFWPKRCPQCARDRHVYQVNEHIVDYNGAESNASFSNISYGHLRSQLVYLMEQISVLQRRVSSLETCKCQHFCTHDGTQYDVGNTWNTSTTCETCTCVASEETTCQPIVCQKIDCKFPVHPPEQCCPTCLRDCQFQNHRFQNGEVVQKGCIQCECQDGSMNCKKLSCPTLNCPVYHQVWATSGRCCKVCKVPDHCLQGRRCPPNSKCINLATSHLCMCQSGYQGDRPWNVSRCIPKYSNNSGEFFNETGPESSSLLGDPLFLAQREDGKDSTSYNKIPCSDKAMQSRACKMCACVEAQTSQAEYFRIDIMVGMKSVTLLVIIHSLWLLFISGV